MAKRPGRPVAIDRMVADELLQYVEADNWLSTACKAAGVAPSTLR